MARYASYTNRWAILKRINLADKVDITNDWRYTNQERYLTGLEFSKMTYGLGKDNTHDHCEFCFEKFSLVFPGALKEGWTDDAKYRWVCDNCFNDFADKLGLKRK